MLGMQADTLSKLFGSPHRPKLLRLFFLNPDAVFTQTEISSRSKVSRPFLRRELVLLFDIGFIRQRNKMVFKTGHSERTTHRLEKGWQLNPNFVYANQLKRLLINADMFNIEEISRRIRRYGKMKAIILAGIFIQDDNSRADMLIVGDHLKRSSLENLIKTMESEIGRELVYGIFSTADFQYRLTVYDKFIRDILDFPHKKVFNKMNF